MNVKDFREFLSHYPDDANVELGKLIAFEGTADEPKGTFELYLDFPILGAAFDEKANDVRLLIEAHPMLQKFGELKKLEDEDVVLE